MGTPQFPDLGKHCSVEECRQIDFLPFTCDCCRMVFCLEHRSYINHKCPKADNRDVTVVICPLCAKGVRLVPGEDPNLSWETHVNTECDPSNYERVAKKRKCPVKGCREVLVFSNTIKCKDCNTDHCLNHRFGSNHGCPGPSKKPDLPTPFLNLLSRNKNEGKKLSSSSSSSLKWSSTLFNAASSIRASAQAGIAKLSGEIEQAFGSATTSGGVQLKEKCPQCSAKFASVSALVEHVKKTHEKNERVIKLPVDVCPKCSKGFGDPVALVEHVERDHGGNIVM